MKNHKPSSEDKRKPMVDLLRSWWSRFLAVEAFFPNFFWAIAIGVCALVWVGSYTDKLAPIVTLLGLGGIFAWAAFLFDLISKKRKEQLQGILDNILSRKLASLVLAAATVLLYGFTRNNGCIILDTTRDTLDRVVTISPVGGDKLYTHSVPPRSKVKFAVAADPNGVKYEIAVDGFPVLVKKVTPFARVKVDSPDAFYRGKTVMLLCPSVPLAELVKQEGEDEDFKEEHRLVVHIDNHEICKIPYAGQTAWLGCGPDEPPSVPMKLQDRRRLEINAAGAPESLLFEWIEPQLCRGVPLLLDNQKVKVIVEKGKENRVIGFGFAQVDPCKGESAFPQVVKIKIKKEQKKNGTQ